MSIVHLLEHNIGTYKQVKCMLLKKHQVALVQATGTGKSFIMLKLLEDLFGGMRVLYVVPYHRIGENFESYVEFKELEPILESFTVKTYDSFSSSKPPVVEDYDVVMIDEFHHLGSALNGRKICEFKDAIVRVGKYVIAVTATPIRALDNYRDMGDEAFTGCVVEGVSAEEAIELGIVKKPIYALAIHDGLTDDYDSDGRVNFPSCTEEVRHVIDAYCKAASPRKWLAYGATVQSLADMQETLHDVFGDIKIFCVHTEQTVRKNESVLQEFIDCREQSVLCSVNILLEGTHLPVPIAGILNFRHIISPNVFWQMMGRLYDVNNVATPLFINIAGTKFYRPHLAFGQRNVGNQYETLNGSLGSDRLLHDVTSVEVIDYLKYSASQLRATGFEYNGKYYASLADFYRKNEQMADVTLNTFLERVRNGNSLEDALMFSSSFVRYGQICYCGKIYRSFRELNQELGIGTITLIRLYKRANAEDEDFSHLVQDYLQSSARHVMKHYCKDILMTENRTER